MTTALATTISRRGWLSRLLMAAAVAPAMGATLAAPVHADKKKKKQNMPSVADRTDSQRLLCETGGGKLAVLDGPNGGNTTECKGGTDDGRTCFNTKNKTSCQAADRTNVPTTNAGGGAAVPPSGGNEDPTSGGSTNAGGGAHVPPSGGIDPSGGGSAPVLE